jgi:predicted GIY-YIG superfamily endonuclease
MQNPKDRFYVGHTDDLIARVANHNRVDKTLEKFTRKNGPWVLVWSEQHAKRSSAMRRTPNQILEISQTHSNHASCPDQLAHW